MSVQPEKKKKDSVTIMVPLTESQVNKLGHDVETTDGFAGALVSAFELNRGIGRWKKAGRPNPLVDSELFQTILKDHVKITNNLLESEVKERDKTIAGLKSKVAIKDTKISELQKTCKEFDESAKRTLNTHESEIRNKDYKIKGLEDSLNDANQNASRQSRKDSTTIANLESRCRQYADRLEGNWFRRFICRTFDI